MTLLAHDLERSSYSSARRDPRRIRLTHSQRTTLKHLGICVLTLLLSGTVLAAVIALRTMIFVSRLHLGGG